MPIPRRSPEPQILWRRDFARTLSAPGCALERKEWPNQTEPVPSRVHCVLVSRPSIARFLRESIDREGFGGSVESHPKDPWTVLLWGHEPRNGRTAEYGNGRTSFLDAPAPVLHVVPATRAQ